MWCDVMCALFRFGVKGEKCKKRPWFWENISCLCPSLGHILHSKYSFRSILKKKLRNIPCEAFYSRVFNEMFIKVPWFHQTSSSFITHLERVFQPPHCENFIRAFFLLPNKHQPTRKNYVIRASPEDVLMSSGRPHLVTYVTPRKISAAVCPWDVLKMSF